MGEMMEKSCTSFLEMLASRSAVPGGGGGAALVGAAGVALGNMVGALTTGKKKYAAVEAEIQQLNARAETLRRELERLVEADAEAFAPLAKVYGIPKDAPGRAEQLEQALNTACGVPLEIMERCAEGIVLAEEYAAKGSVLARSDAGCAALFCKAALQAAGLNVTVNTRLMAHRTRAAQLNSRAEALLTEFVPRADRVFAQVDGQLKGE